MKYRLFRVFKQSLILSYIIVAMGTFGWIASSPRICYNWDRQPAKCELMESVSPAIAGGVFWPLYWTWNMMEYVRGR